APVKSFPNSTILVGPGPASEHPPAGSSAGDEGGGGGGGGRHDLTPPTIGLPPPFSLSESIIAPTTRPDIEPPSLPVPETLLGPPAPRVEAATGAPTGTTGPVSDGPGSDGGIGTGERGGVGPGHGPGAGPGDEGGKGGGLYGPGRPRHLAGG